MPPKGAPVPMPKKSRVPPAQQQIAEEVELGNIKIGKSGIKPISADGENSFPKTINIDDLTLVKELGKGAQGTVALYKHKQTREKFAVKKISLAGKEKTGLQTVAAEISTVFMEPSPYAIKLHNGFLREGHLLLVMEYMDFGNLEELLSAQPRMPEAAASYLAAQVVNGLATLHMKQQFAGVKEGSKKRQIHRDIKPANILLSRRGDVKLADYGVAATADTIGVASFVGTQTHMSPERIRGQRYGTASDVWSVGIVVAQALMGVFPFGGSEKVGFMALLKEVTTTEQIKLPQDCSAEAQSFVDACCKQDADLRSSADQLLDHPWIRRYNAATSRPAAVPEPSSPAGAGQDGGGDELLGSRAGSSIVIPESPTCEGKSAFISLLTSQDSVTMNRPQLSQTFTGTSLDAGLSGTPTTTPQ